MNVINQRILILLGAAKHMNYIRWTLLSMLSLFFSSFMLSLARSESGGLNFVDIAMLFIVAGSASFCLFGAAYRAMAYESVYQKPVALIVDTLIIAGLFELYRRIELAPNIAPFIFLTVFMGYLLGLYAYLIEKRQANND